VSNFSKKFSSEKFKNMLKRPCLVCWWRAIQTKGRGERRPWRLWLKDGRERASENLKNYYFPFYLFGNTNFWYFILDWKICTKWRMRWRQKQLWADFDWTFRLSIGAESAKKCCPFFWSESFIYFVEFWSFGRVRFTCLGAFLLVLKCLMMMRLLRLSERYSRRRDRRREKEREKYKRRSKHAGNLNETMKKKEEKK
jgi:hypothetical protein